MADGSGDYLTALRDTQEYADPSIGFTNTNIPGTVGQDKVLIAQNNVIISLLISLHNKINMLLTERQAKVIYPELEEISLMIKNLNVKERKKPTLEPVKFATIFKPEE